MAISLFTNIPLEETFDLCDDILFLGKTCVEGLN